MPTEVHFSGWRDSRNRLGLTRLSGLSGLSFGLSRVIPILWDVGISLNLSLEWSQCLAAINASGHGANFKGHGAEWSRQKWYGWNPCAFGSLEH